MGTLGYGLPVPPAGQVELARFTYTTSGGSSLPVPTVPTGIMPPSQLRILASEAPQGAGAGVLNLVVANPLLSPAAPGEIFLWNSPPPGETLQPAAGNGAVFTGINLWPARPPRECSAGGPFAPRDAFFPPGSQGYSLTRGEMAVRLVRAQMDSVEAFVCDRPVPSTAGSLFGVPSLNVTVTGPAGTATVTFRWQGTDTPEQVLVTGLAARPTFLGVAAKECRYGARGSERFFVCDPPSSADDLVVRVSRLVARYPDPAVAQGGPETALFVDGLEVGPFLPRIPSRFLKR